MRSRPAFAPAGKTVIQASFESDWDYWKQLRDDMPAYEAEKARVADEALARLERHFPGVGAQVVSDFPKVRIELVQNGAELQVVIQDWGVGFGSEKEHNDCFGLKGIRERARLLGGAAVVEMAPDRGTRIAVTLPVVPRGDE